MDEKAAVRNFRDFLTVYNTFTEKCFNHCVSNLNYRILTPEEEICVDRCASKLVNVNHRLIGTYMEVSPLAKMMGSEDQGQIAASQAEQIMQQQQSLETVQALNVAELKMENSVSPINPDSDAGVVTNSSSEEISETYNETL
ncbi:uncharacterized protein LOC144438817 [Glandiceps talaboti]